MGGPLPPSAVFPYQTNAPYEHLLAPARRASIVMLVLGAITLACGACTAFVGTNLNRMPLQTQAKLSQLEAQFNGTISFQSIFIGGGIGCGLLPGVLLIILGILCRRGGIGVLIPALLLAIFSSLEWGYMVISSIIAIPQSGGAIGVFAATGLCLALAILMLVWIIQALRNSGKLAIARQQQAEQILYYQQMQQYQHQQYMAQQQQMQNSAASPSLPPLPPPPV